MVGVCDAELFVCGPWMVMETTLLGLPCGQPLPHGGGTAMVYGMDVQPHPQRVTLAGFHTTKSVYTVIGIAPTCCTLQQQRHLVLAGVPAVANMQFMALGDLD